MKIKRFLAGALAAVMTACWLPAVSLVSAEEEKSYVEIPVDESGIVYMVGDGALLVWLCGETLAWGDYGNASYETSYAYAVDSDDFFNANGLSITFTVTSTDEAFLASDHSVVVNYMDMGPDEEFGSWTLSTISADSCIGNSTYTFTTERFDSLDISPSYGCKSLYFEIFNFDTSELEYGSVYDNQGTAVISDVKVSVYYSDTLQKVDYKYRYLEDGTISITGYTGEGGEVVIPAEINGTPVTEIGSSAFSRNADITSVIIPEGVCKLYNYCFGGTSLTSIDIPSTVNYIDWDIFQDVKTLTAINVDENNVNYTSVDGVLFSKDMSTIVRYPQGKKETSYVIPDSVTEMEIMAFYGCTSLTSVTIPDGVTEIPASAFQGCSGLTSVTIPEGVASIGYVSFAYCTGLASVVIPDGVTTIGPYAFVGCTNLTSVTIPASVTDMDSPFEQCSPDLVVYGYTDSYAETYAKEHDLKFAALDAADEEQLVDKETGVELSAEEGVIPEGATLSVEPIKDEEVEEIIREIAEELDIEISEDAHIIVFDISLVNSQGVTVQPDGTVTVKIPLPEDFAEDVTYYVYHVADDGKLTDMKATVDKDGYISFTTDHFSKYLLSDEKLIEDGAGDTDTDDEDKNVPTGVSVLLIPAVTAAAAVLISRKRK